MNRTDEISAVARDIAEQITPAPEQRDIIADNLVKLVCLVVQGVGKSVAGEGESSQNEALDYGEEVPGEAVAAHNRYLVGEEIQNGVRWVQEEAVTADLDRWPEGKGWVSKLPAPATHEPCDPACEAYGHTQSTPDPFAPGELTQLAHQTADEMRAQKLNRVPEERPLFAPGAEEYYRQVLGLGPKPVSATRDRQGVAASLPPVPVPGEVFESVPFTVKHPLQLCDNQDCPAHGDAGRIGPCVQDAPVQVPVVLHTWVTATDGDTGATLDYIHCGVCGVRRCDGGCGDATVGAAPDVDCPTHGNDVARQCVDRCVGCGGPGNVGMHGPSQGFGGCC